MSMPLIMVVDDSRSIANFIALALKSAGYRAEAVTSALECVSRARSSRPDLIIMDVMMPGMDGATAAAIMQDTPEFRNIPVILLSALSEEELRARASESGAAGYIAKPFRKESILRAVRACFAAAPAAG